MWQNPQFPADWVTLAEEILNEKLNFLCRAIALEVAYFPIALELQLYCSYITFIMEHAIIYCNDIGIAI